MKKKKNHSNLGINYDLTYTGKETQKRLDKITENEDSIAAEQQRAEEAEQGLQNNIEAEQQRAEEAEQGLQNNIEAIEELIPGQATKDNQLADKNFVNSSISTATAEFKGTYNSLEELKQQASDADANDYGFVVEKDSDGNTVYNRYKYVEGEGWKFEYALNNSSFTAVQWAAINSAITSGDVEKLRALPTKTELDALLAKKADKTEIADMATMTWVDAQGYLKKIPTELTDENLLTLSEGYYWADHNNSCSNKPSNVTAFALMVMKTGVNNKHLTLISGAHKAAVSNGDIYYRDLNEGEWASWTKAPTAADKLVYSRGYDSQTIEGEIKPGSISTGNITSSGQVSANTVVSKGETVNGKLSAQTIDVTNGSLSFTGGTPTITTNVALRLNPGGQGVLMQTGDFYAAGSIKLQGNSDNLLAPAATLSATGFKAQSGTANEVFTRDGSYKTIGTDWKVADVVVKPALSSGIQYVFDEYHTASISTEKSGSINNIDAYDLTYNGNKVENCLINAHFVVQNNSIYNGGGGNRYIQFSGVDFNNYSVVAVRTTDNDLAISEVSTLNSISLGDGTYIKYGNITTSTVTINVTRYMYVYGIYFGNKIVDGAYKKGFSSNVLIHIPISGGAGGVGDVNLSNYVKKSGDTMTGILHTNHNFEVYNGSKSSKVSSYMRFSRDGVGGSDYVAIGNNGTNFRICALGGDANYTVENDLLLIGNNKQLKLQAPNGTAPITTNSTTKVDNLNADMLDGKHDTNFAAVELIKNIDDTSLLSGIYRISQDATGTFPSNVTGLGSTIYINKWDNNSGHQILQSYGTQNSYVRYYKNADYSEWKKIAFTDSTVAAASKLATARTLWGQSFDGSADVNGSIEVNGNVKCTALMLDNDGIPGITIKGNTISSSEDGLVLKDNSTDNKVSIGNNLEVNGGITATGIKANSSTSVDLSTSGTIKMIGNIQGSYLSDTTGWTIGGLTGNARFNKVAVNNGKSSQFLKADGSLDDTQYVSLGGNQTITGVKTFQSEYVWFGKSDFGFYNNVVDYCGFRDETGGIDIMAHKDLNLYGDDGSECIQISEAGISASSTIRQPSDIRLKDIKGDATLSVDDIAGLSAIKFTYKKDKTESVNVGAIAQEWQKILPEVVKEGKDGMLALDYSGAAMAAVISLAKEVVELKKQIYKN